MKFPKTIKRVKFTLSTFGGEIKKAQLRSEDYSKEDLISLKNEMLESGLKGERLQRVRSTVKIAEETDYSDSELIMIKAGD